MTFQWTLGVNGLMERKLIPFTEDGIDFTYLDKD